MDISHLHLSRPEKITWRFPQTTGDVLEKIKSKTLRKFLRNAEIHLQEKNITWEYKELSFADFQAWLPYYESKMQENGYDIIASGEWYEKRKSSGLTIEGMFFYQAGQLVCSGIFTRDSIEKATFAFKASERLDLSGESNSSIGAVVDYFFLREMAQKGVKIISAGRSRNAFGVINNFGYLDYKLRFGYEPQATEDTPMLQEVPLDEEGVVMFYAYEGDQFKLIALQPRGLGKHFEQSRFATPELPFQMIEYDP